MATLLPSNRPLGVFDRFNEMMEDIFDTKLMTTHWLPRVDVKDTEKETVYVVELPGMTMEDIDVEVLNDMLTIKGKREMRDEVRRDDYVRIERQYGNFLRQFRLVAPTEPNLVKATYKDGLLTVAVPKRDVKPTHRVPILPK